MKVPTDLQILQEIFNQYYYQFEQYESSKDRNTKIYVPIDVNLIGNKLGVDGDIVFGRLYYHLNRKFSFKNDDGSKVDLFALSMGSAEKEELHCIQFPYMVSILAELKYENKKFRIATIVAAASLAVSLVAICISIWG